MKRVSYKKVFLELSDDFGSEVLNNEAWLYRHLKHIELYDIGGKYAFQRSAKKYTVTDYTVDVPDDAIEILKVYLGDYEDEFINFYNESPVNVLQYSPTDNHSDSDLHGYIWGNLYYNDDMQEVDFEVEGSKVKLYETYNNEEVTLQYWKFETNQNDEILINESHIPALKYGLIVKWLEKDVFKRYKSKKLLRGNDIGYVKDYRSKYAAAVRKARSDDNKENEKLQRKQINIMFKFPVGYRE